MQVKKKYWNLFIEEFNSQLSNAFAISISISEPFSPYKILSLDERYNILRAKCLITPITNIDISICERKYDGYHVTTWLVPITKDFIYLKNVPDCNLLIILPTNKIDMNMIDKLILTYLLSQIYIGIQLEEPVVFLSQNNGISMEILSVVASLIPNGYSLCKYGDLHYVTNLSVLNTKEGIKQYLYGPAIIPQLLKTCIAPIIVSNGTLDIMLLYYHLIGNLPDTRLLFVGLINKIFPRIIDIRYNMSRNGYVDYTFNTSKYSNLIHSHNRTYEEPHSFDIASAYVTLVLDRAGIEENIMYSPFCNEVWTWNH